MHLYAHRKEVGAYMPTGRKWAPICPREGIVFIAADNFKLFSFSILIWPSRSMESTLLTFFSDQKNIQLCNFACVKGHFMNSSESALKSE